tara:strand:- start:1069 stop:1467 length:399 start_codon:yes stop_codon:yes gene_type:complete
MKFQFNDGGREAAGYKGKVGDCVVRALVIANDLDYKTTYRKMSQGVWELGRPKTARSGVNTAVFYPMLKQLGWVVVPKKDKLRFRLDNLPRRKKVIVETRKHICVVIDGVIQDTWESSKNGDALIEKIWVKK